MRQVQNLHKSFGDLQVLKGGEPQWLVLENAH